MNLGKGPGNDPPKNGGDHSERECACCIKVERSIVIIICNADDVDRLCQNLKQIAELRDEDPVAGKEEV
ncbi:MAG: hypothetical protein ACPLQO_00470, partial [Desulfotomaculales bacterium]